MSEADGRVPSPRVTVFCSTAENIGQTTTLLNTAVLLARSGRRVLVLDARHADTRTRTYVRSVTPGPPLLPGTEDGPAVEEWQPGGAEHPVGIVTLKGPDAVAGLPGPGHPAFARYDDVLVDAPLIRTDRQAAALARLPSVLVVCFTAASAFIESAVELAERLRHEAGRPLDVLALALQTDPGHEDQLRLARERVRERFAPLGDGRPVRHLEIPYHALSERSTRLGMETEPGNGFDERVRPALQRLVRALDRPRFAPPARAVLVHSPRHAVWAEWLRDLLWSAAVDVTLRSYGDWRPEPPADDEVVLLLPPTAPGPEDEQALRWLSDPGIRLVLVDDEALPRAFAHHPQIDLRRLTEQQAAARLRHSLALRAPTTTAPRGRRFPSLPDHTNIAARNTAFVGREDLLAELRATLADQAAAGRPCLLVGAPGVGKSETLLEYCHRFGGSYDVVWWLQGGTPGEALAALGALGDALGEPTTQDAAAHVRALRARADTEGRRWLLVCDEIGDTDTADAPGGDSGTDVGSGADTGRASGGRPGRETGDTGDTGTGHGDPGDGRDHPADPAHPGGPAHPGARDAAPRGDLARAGEIAALLPAPSEHCHVLLGVRGSRASAAAVEVPPFTRQESEALLTTLVRGLTPTAAQDVAKRVGPLPLAVRLAACWLRVATARAEARNEFGQEALSQAVNSFSQAYDDRQQAHAAKPLPSVEVLLHLTRTSLLRSPAAEAWAREETGSAALEWLLQACALLTSAGTDLKLLRSRPLALALATSGGDPATRPHGTPARPADGPLVDASLWALNRHGLIDFDFARPRQPVRQHRVLRDLIRCQMGDEERARRRTELRAVIAAARTETDEDDRTAPTPQTLLRRGRQIDALRLWQDDRPEVQSALLGHVADLIVSQEKQALDEALRLTRKAQEHWRPDSFEGLRLRSMMSQTLRLMQEYGDSARLARGVLQTYRTQLGLGHPRSLLMADAYAANLGAAGHFRDALDEGLHVARSMLRLVGPRHWAGVQVRRNLAWRYAMVGNATEGLRILRELYEHLRAVHGDDAAEVQDMVPALAQMHRLLGQTIESYQLLKNTRILRHPVEPRITGVPLEVKAENGLAVSERRLGRHDRARERDTRIVGLAAAVLGERSVTTLCCRFSLAVDHHLAGDHDGAVRESAECLRVLRSTLGDEHPSTHLCRIRLGVHLRGAGRAREADETGREAREGLERRLGRHHPWVLAAGASLANTLVARGDLAAAEVLEESVVRGYDRTGLGRHPDRAVVADNLAMTRAERGGAPPGGEVPRVRRDIDLELL
ncbi:MULTISPECIES: FxSxx-COOH system tetratricopeptide repeat protein [Streptomyces]|uniref:FxSxx-COOH system tetratricopeptide repeat protein n=1 Tax=Streptomyces griseosporeus TaxID=1910 RepID=A0ABV3KWH0_STRGS|nr:FxSxx-COOH system tetratricopeptide repeat protein [Streptomyces actuosus]